MASPNLREMADWSAALLRRGTGEGVPEWNRRVLASGVDNERDLRVWLRERGVTGYPQMLLVMERFGYPPSTASPSDGLVDAQYADRPELRPILDRLLAEASLLGRVLVRPRRTHVTLLSPRRAFAVVKAATRTRVDLGLRLPGRAPAPSPGNAAITLWVGVVNADDLPDGTLAHLRHAYTTNS